MGEPATAPASWLARLLMWPVRVYQSVRADRPSPCRHVPSCSTYALEALETHGPVKGTWLGVRRLLRCHPWGTSGYDPVPERKAN
jgi:putative membrane protein insertion efficiency factor